MFTIQFFFFGFFARSDTPKARETYAKVLFVTSCILSVVVLTFMIFLWIEWKTFPLYGFLIWVPMCVFSFYTAKVAKTFSDLVNNPTHGAMI